jgi:dimethylamine/trimethylamine dehydrogenase
VKMDSSPTDCAASRFTPEGSHEPVIDFVKKVTTKPVVGVGRFTSPDAMVSQLKRGILDLIGGARPSIADPFLPRKIDEGREDEIRECIGCNICISSWHDSVPVRCTQNPTVGEEWRRGWHPERMQPKRSDDKILVVGGGPAGLECALSLARRGYSVTLADKNREFGGRLRFETKLPGLNAWRRVLDYRLGRLQTMTKVDLFLESDLTADDILEFGCQHVVTATGSSWTTEIYTSMEIPVGRINGPNVFTPSDLAAGRVPKGPTVVFDFDNYYMGGVVAELLAEQGNKVTYVTPAGHASAWTIMTNELPRVHQALSRRGIAVTTLNRVIGFDGETATLAQLFTGEESKIACRNLVIVGMRRPEDALYHALMARDLAGAGIKSVQRAGDALTPGAIVHAVHSGHRVAREIDEPVSDEPYKLDAPIVLD